MIPFLTCQTHQLWHHEGMKAAVKDRVLTGHRKPGKSGYLSISVSRPGKSLNLIFGHGK